MATAPPAGMQIEAGTVLAARYRAVTLLGRGGMGEVWACFDLDEKRTVAAKLVHGAFVGDAAMRRLFQAEIVAVARLSHPGIVEVYDLLSLPDGSSLLIMALRPGKPLDEALGASPSWHAIRAVFRALLEALAHAHARSVLHLDLKPDNVLVGAPPRLETTIVDFGIARVLRPGHGAESWHEDGSVMGTPEYMAPEQAFGELERFGPWTDLYALGLLAHELCTGRLPFADAHEPVEAARIRIETPAPRMRPTVPGVPEAFVDLCSTLLELSPTERPACAADVLAALEDIPDAGPPPDAASLGAASPERAAMPTLPRDPASASQRAVPPPRDSRPGSLTGRSRPLSTRFGSRGDGSLEEESEVGAPSPGAYGLFGLRELPVLGRIEERRALWDTIRATIESPGLHAALLSGPAGTGKSRLARDAVERALQLGVAVDLSTHWSASSSPDEGLAGLVENALGSRGSRGDAFEARLSFFLERFPIDAVDVLAREVRVLLRPARDAAPDAGLPVRVARDVVACVAEHRPVILRLDDVHWSRGEGAALVRELAKLGAPHGICVLGTERDGEAREDYRAALGDATRLEHVAMHPLGPDATSVMIRGLLDLDDELASVVARRSEGNPLFARQLVAQLVRERAVERRGRRYVLAKDTDVDHAVPEDMRTVWARYVEVSGAAPPHLAVLALVRERVSREVVDSLAALLGDPFTESFNRALASGLLRAEGDLFAYSHGLLRDYLLGTIGPEDAPALNGLAADALRVLVGREDVEEARAQHLMTAGRTDEAFESMLAAAMWSWRRAERGARQRRLEQLVTWTWGRDEAQVVRARALAELSHCHAEAGSIEEANRLSAECHAQLAQAEGRPGFDGAAGWAGLRDGQVMRLQGRGLDGAAASERGILHARRAGELEVESLCLAQLGLDAYRRGDHDASRSRFEASLELARRAKNRATEAQVVMSMSGLEAPEKMAALCQRAVRMASDAGALRIEIFARLTWVEALHRVGDVVRAREECGRLSELAQHRGMRQVASMAELNLACWAALVDDWPRARGHRAKAEAWGASTGAAPERAVAAAVDVALAFCAGEDAKEALSALVREGRTYRETHFDAVVVKLLTMAPQSARGMLLVLDASRGRPVA